MAYNAEKVEAFNKARAQGLTYQQAARAAGLTPAEIFSVSVDKNGVMGPLSQLKADTDTRTMTKEEAAAEKAEEDRFYNTGLPRTTPYAQTANTTPGLVRTTNYTETSTTSISGGGSTTIVATPAKATPASQALDAQAQTTQREIEALQLANSGLGPGPQLTEQQMAANDAKILQLQQQYNQRRDAAEAAKTPSPPSITTVPNTTTTINTVAYERGVEVTPVNASDPAQTVQVTEAGVTTTVSQTVSPEVDTALATPAVPAADTFIPGDVGADQDITVTARGVAAADTRVAETAPESPPQQSVYPVAYDDEGNLLPGYELNENGDPVQFNPDTPPTVYGPAPAPGVGIAYDEEGNLLPGYTLDENNNPVFVGGDFIEPTAGPAGVPPSQAGPTGTPYDDDGNLNPGWTLDENNNPVYVGGNFVEPATVASAAASRQAATKALAQKQATIQARYKQPGNADWRVRLSLAPGAQYLYNATPAGVLAPLKANGGTDGVIFPYTPSITTTYSANYEQYDLIHSNYRGLFYKNSRVGDIQVRGTFTAQDTTEANYLLAVIHFFRSVTKMFYGQDEQRGTPPPICLLNGFGGYQFSDHPVVVSAFNYTLPNDVDYIRTTNPNNFGLNLVNRYNPAGASLPAGGALAGLNRLLNAIPGGLNKGALPKVPAPNSVAGSVTNNVPASYVPTKIEIDITLIPVQTRSQVSNQFSLKGFANGDLLKGGFW